MRVLEFHRRDGSTDRLQLHPVLTVLGIDEAQREMLHGLGHPSVALVLPTDLPAPDPDHRQRIVRRVTAVRGTTDLTMTLSARPDYGRTHPETEAVAEGVLITGGDVRLGLTASVELHLRDGDVLADLTLRQGQEALFVLEVLGEVDDAQTDAAMELGATLGALLSDG